MSSKTVVAQFTFSWQIEWAQFKELSTKDISKYFITAWKNVSFRWQIKLSCKDEETEANKFSFHIFYDFGPIAELKGLGYSIELMQSGKSVRKLRTVVSDFERNYGFGLSNFEEKDVESFQTKYNLTDSEPLHCQVKLEIPMSVFSFSENLPPPVESAPWSRTFFRQIEDPEKAIFSNAKLISKEGAIFYCHEVVLGYQSEVLSAIFRHPESQNVKKGEYNFPALSTNNLRALLEFLYTGQATLINIPTTEILEVADAAEQYGLKILKQMCLAHLWKRVVQKPEDCFVVIRFSDLHDDWKYLKDRAMDVLTDNFENVGLQSMDLKTQFGGGERGERLRKKFTLYGYRRVQPYFP